MEHDHESMQEYGRRSENGGIAPVFYDKRTAVCRLVGRFSLDSRSRIELVMDGLRIPPKTLGKDMENIRHIKKFIEFDDPVAIHPKFRHVLLTWFHRLLDGTIKHSIQDAEFHQFIDYIAHNPKNRVINFLLKERFSNHALIAVSRFINALRNVYNKFAKRAFRHRIYLARRSAEYSGLSLQDDDRSIICDELPPVEYELDEIQRDTDAMD
jgi:hypothetical protein